MYFKKQLRTCTIQIPAEKVGIFFLKKLTFFKGFPLVSNGKIFFFNFLKVQLSSDSESI